MALYLALMITDCADHQRNVLQGMRKSESSKVMPLGTILYVEADELVRATTVAVLETVGYRVYIAHTKREGLAWLLQHAPDFVLVAEPLPDGTAIELARLTHLHYPHTATIIVTPFFVEADVTAADRVLAKPLLAKHLVASLKELAKPATDS